MRQGGRSSQKQARMETNEGRQMKGDKVTGAAKSRPERRSCRETNEGRVGQNGDHAGRQMKGDKVAAAGILGISNPIFEK